MNFQAQYWYMRRPGDVRAEFVNPAVVRLVVPDPEAGLVTVHFDAGSFCVYEMPEDLRAAFATQLREPGE